MPVPQCDSGAGFAALPSPTVGGTPLVVPGNLDLAPATTYQDDEAFFVRVSDFDQNSDPTTRQTVDVVI